MEIGIEYAGYDALDTILTADRVLCIAVSQVIALEQPLDLMPIHKKILEQANITLNHKGKVVEK